MSHRLVLAAAVLASAVAASPAGAQVSGYDNPYAYDAVEEDYGPRVRPSGAFSQVRYELEDAGYTRIKYLTEREDDYGHPVYFLKACKRGVRYRLHVTADCKIELKRRTGYCRRDYSY